MTSPTLCQKLPRTDCPTPSALQFRHSSQTDQVSSGKASNCEGPFANTETEECGVPHPMLGLSNAYVGRTGPQLSTRVKKHKGAVRRQDKTSLLVLHCLTNGHTFH